MNLHLQAKSATATRFYLHPESFMDKRWTQMDVAKGLGILVIVLGHNWFTANSKELLYPLLASFIIPLFFFLSGVFFKPEQDLRELAIRKADAILKPFFFTMLMYVLVRSILRDQPLLPDIAGVLYASVDTIPWQALWFLPHFWAAILVSWLVLRLLRPLQLQLPGNCAVLVGLLLLGIGMIKCFWHIPVSVGGHAYLLPGLPFSLDVVFISSAYFLLGYVLRARLRTHHSSALTMLLSAALFASVFIFTGASMDIAQRRYDHWLWSTLLAISGTYCCWALSGLLMRFGRAGKVMTYIGQSTLIILIFHGEIQNKTFTLLAHFEIAAPICALISLITALVAPLLISEVIKRVALLRFFYLPFPTAKQQTPKEKENKVSSVSNS